MTPEDALALAKQVSDIYAQATADLLSLISRRLSRGLAAPGWAEERLAEILELRRRANVIVQRMQTEGTAAVLRALEDAYRGGRLDVLSSLDSPGMTGVNRRAVGILAADAQRALNSTAPRVLRWTEDTYRSVIADVTSSTITGTSTRAEAAARAMDRFALRGVTGFVDAAGRNWTLDTYTEMATRTGTGQAFLEGTLDKYRANGDDLVIVSNSPEECPLCRPYEGNVLSISGSLVSPVELPAGIVFMGALSEARSAGLFHPNCTHRADRYVPGLTKPNPDTANPRGYEDRQRQRELERRVRESKRRVLALEPLGNTDALRRQKALLRDRSTALRDFNTEHGRKQAVSNRRVSLTSR